jgi:FPC/CPF motif-containing protein YcgG
MIGEERKRSKDPQNQEKESRKDFRFAKYLFFYLCALPSKTRRAHCMPTLLLLFLSIYLSTKQNDYTMQDFSTFPSIPPSLPPSSFAS